MTALSNLVGEWNDPTAAAERVVEYDDWSAGFDANHPLRSAEQIEEITAMRRIKAAQGGGIVSRNLTK